MPSCRRTRPLTVPILIENTAGGGNAIARELDNYGPLWEEIGDYNVKMKKLMAFLEAGAYQESSASNFNALPRPASVLVRGDRAELVKRAETVDDVYARDVVSAELRAEATEHA